MRSTTYQGPHQGQKVYTAGQSLADLAAASGEGGWTLELERTEDILATVQYFPNDLRRRMQDIIKQKIDAGVVRPTRGMQILEQYMACFKSQTYFDTSAEQ